MRFLFLLLIFSLGALSADSIQKKKGILLQADDPDDMKRWAIVIGVNDYNDNSISKLTKARNDAKILGEILKSNGEFEDVFVMTDDISAKDTHYPTKRNIEAKVEKILSDAGPDDLVLFFFSGHGSSSEEKQGFVVPVDASTKDLHGTSVSVDLIAQKMRDKGLKKTILILDACRDVFTKSKGVKSEVFQAEQFQDTEMAATFFSTGSGNFSYEDSETDFGVFTRFLAEGMDGKADGNKDGIVTFNELEAYVQSKVSKWSRKYNKEQKPFVRYHGEKSGDIPITVKGKKSRVDEFMKKRSGRYYLTRSALIPGWGQWEKKQKVKSISIFGFSVFFLASWISNDSAYNSLSTKFESQKNVNLLANLSGNTFNSAGLVTYLQVNDTASQMNTAANSATIFSFAFIGLYLFNLADAYFDKPNSDFSFDMYRSPVPTFDGFTKETYATAQYTFRW
ncbi:MAG: caspase family protein [Leptospiraceae bacterium]|nr:caspase family protein [Leptospiraceae bacterium]